MFFMRITALSALNRRNKAMKYIVVIIQKAEDGKLTTAILNYDDINAAKAKAYTELAYGFSGVLKLCTVAIMDEQARIIYRDTYTAPEKGQEASDK